MDDSPGHVLVIEDDPEINDIVGAYMELAGFRRRSSLTGLDGLRDALEHRPVLVMLDLMLPDLDGIEVCRRLKDDERTREIPVVILTALHQADMRKRAKEAGAVEYLTKPFDPDRLLDVVRINTAPL